MGLPGALSCLPTSLLKILLCLCLPGAHVCNAPMCSVLLIYFNTLVQLSQINGWKHNVQALTAFSWHHQGEGNGPIWPEGPSPGPGLAQPCSGSGWEHVGCWGCWSSAWAVKCCNWEQHHCVGRQGGLCCFWGSLSAMGCWTQTVSRAVQGALPPMSACGRGTQEQGRGWEPFSISLWGLKEGGL